MRKTEVRRIPTIPQYYTSPDFVQNQALYNVTNKNKHIGGVLDAQEMGTILHEIAAVLKKRAAKFEKNPMEKSKQEKKERKELKKSSEMLGRMGEIFSGVETMPLDQLISHPEHIEKKADGYPSRTKSRKSVKANCKTTTPRSRSHKKGGVCGRSGKGVKKCK